KTALAGAIRYATSRWQALTRFAHDGRLEISNNAAERAIRPLALGRKNYLFAGSDVGGERGAERGLKPAASVSDAYPEPSTLLAMHLAQSHIHLFAARARDSSPNVTGPRRAP
ncbi:MAG: transposase, partial [Geminicoccaceae bacterium]